jgi:hypothetical protein
MSGWGALTLALALYGVIVLLEWTYRKILATSRPQAAGISLVLLAASQERRIEHAIREMVAFWHDAAALGMSVEILIWLQEPSDDQTPLIVDRLAQKEPDLKVLSGAPSVATVRQYCQYPIIVWLDLARAADWSALWETVRRMVLAPRPSSWRESPARSAR